MLLALAPCAFVPYLQGTLWPGRSLQSYTAMHDQNSAINVLCICGRCRKDSTWIAHLVPKQKSSLIIALSKTASCAAHPDQSAAPAQHCCQIPRRDSSVGKLLDANTVARPAAVWYASLRHMVLPTLGAQTYNHHQATTLLRHAAATGPQALHGICRAGHCLPAICSLVL